MKITYQNRKHIPAEALKSLFLSVNWASGEYPELLSSALKHYGSVFTAWDGARLVGLIAAMDDGCMTAYIHYLLVDPAYQKQGIGKHLLDTAKAYYKDYLKLLLNAVPEQKGFYEACGFQMEPHNRPMQITSMKN